MDAKEIRDKLLCFRAKYGISQHKLSAISGLSHTTINKIENGKPVAQITLAKVNLFIDEYDKKHAEG